MNTISSEKACEILKNGGKLVDVRTPAEYSQGFLPNAISLPLQQIMAADNMFEINMESWNFSGHQTKVKVLLLIC